MSDNLKKMYSFLEKINKDYKKKYGGNILFKGNEIGDFQPLLSYFPTIDYINSGLPGFPRGGITLIHGLESTGKSTLVLESFAENIRKNPDFCFLYVDVENALGKTFLLFKNICDERLNVTPLNCEDALVIVEDAIKQNIYDGICLDSLAKFESEDVLKKSMTDTVKRNQRATMLTEFLRRIPYTLRRSKTALICINQLIENQDRKNKYDIKYVLPGGKQQLYSANLRLSLTRSKTIKSGDKNVGYRVSITTAKNKLAAREKVFTYLSYIYNQGFIREFSLLDYLVAIGFVKKNPTGRYEFIRKEIYDKSFWLSETMKVYSEIKNNLNIDLFEIKPNSDIEFEKNSDFSDVGTFEEDDEVLEEVG